MTSLCISLQPITDKHAPRLKLRAATTRPPSALQERAIEVALRFCRLNEQWGPWGLAWWETLLRAADQQASRANEENEPMRLLRQTKEKSDG